MKNSSQFYLFKIQKQEQEIEQTDQQSQNQYDQLLIQFNIKENNRQQEINNEQSILCKQQEKQFIQRPMSNPEMYGFEFQLCNDINDKIGYFNPFEELKDTYTEEKDEQTTINQNVLKENEFNVNKDEILNYCTKRNKYQNQLTYFNIPVYFNNIYETIGLYDIEYALQNQKESFILANKYEVQLKQYSSDGAFSIVFIGKDLDTNEMVAIKMNKEEQHIQQMINEKYQTQNHHFVQLKDYFFQNMKFFIVMEFCGENTYQLYINKQEKVLENPQLFQEIYNITQDVIDSMQFLNSLGINHFDIKPENICLRENQTKIIDIGSCSFFDNQNYHFYLQSRFYRAPESFLCLQLDNRADVYSFGAVLYEILTGHPLFVTDVEQQLYSSQIASQIGINDFIPEYLLQLQQTDSDIFGPNKFFTKQGRIYLSIEQIKKSLDSRFMFQLYGHGAELQQLILEAQEKKQDYLVLVPNYLPILELMQLSIKTKIDQQWFGLIKLCQTLLEFDVTKRVSIDKINVQQLTQLTDEEKQEYQNRIDKIFQIKQKYESLFGKTEIQIQICQSGQQLISKYKILELYQLYVNFKMKIINFKLLNQNLIQKKIYKYFHQDINQKIYLVLDVKNYLYQQYNCIKVQLIFFNNFQVIVSMKIKQIVVIFTIMKNMRKKNDILNFRFFPNFQIFQDNGQNEELLIQQKQDQTENKQKFSIQNQIKLKLSGFQTFNLKRRVYNQITNLIKQNIDVRLPQQQQIPHSVFMDTSSIKNKSKFQILKNQMENAQQEQKLQNTSITVQLTIGRVFISKYYRLPQDIQTGLALAKIASLINNDSELILLQRQYKNRFDSLLQQLFKITNFNKNNLLNMIISGKNIFKNKDLIMQCFEASQQLLDVYIRIRQVKKVLDDSCKIINPQQQYKINKSNVDPQEIKQLNDFAYIYTQLWALQDIQNKILIIKQEEQKEYINQIIETIPEKQSSVQLQMLTNTELAQNYSVIVNTFQDKIMKQKVKISIIADQKIVQSQYVMLQDLIKVGGHLGIDLSTQKQQLSYVYQGLAGSKRLPQLGIELQTGRSKEYISLPLTLNSKTSICEVDNDKIAFTAGYHLVVNGPLTQAQLTNVNLLQADPNLEIQKSLQQNKEEQKLQEPEQPQMFQQRPVKYYKGGNWFQYKSYLLDQFQPDQKTGLVNLIEKLSSNNMIKFATGIQKQKTQEQQEQQQDVWLTSQGDPLFFSQYLSAITQLLNKPNEQQSLQYINILVKFQNPFNPAPIAWRTSPLFLNKVFSNSKLLSLYQQFISTGIDVTANDLSQINETVEQYNKQPEKANIEPENLPLSIVQSQFITCRCQLQNFKLIDFTDQDPYSKCFFIAYNLNGAGYKQQKTDKITVFSNESQNQNQSVMFEFNIPLPEIINEKNQLVGYELSEYSLASLPYNIKLSIYLYNEQLNEQILMGKQIIQLRDTFLLDNINKSAFLLCQNKNFQFQCDLKVNLVTNITSSQNSVIWKQYQSTGPDFQQIQMLDKKSYSQFGVECQILGQSGQKAFYNDFLIDRDIALELITMLNISNIQDCIQFCLSIPYVPLQLAAYYSKQPLENILLEQRVTFDQILNLNACDNFEHACILSSCLQAIGIQNYVVKYITGHSISYGCQFNGYIVNSVTGLAIQQNSQQIQQICTKFNYNQIIIYGNSIQQYVKINHTANCKKFNLNQLIQIPKNLEQMVQFKERQLEEFLQNELSASTQNNINWIEGDEQIKQWETTYNYEQFYLQTAFEDSACLSEKVIEGQIHVGGLKLQNLSIKVKIRAFSTKFGFIQVYVNKYGTKRDFNQQQQQESLYQGNKYAIE